MIKFAGKPFEPAEPVRGRAERLASALSGAMRAGDRQADELARLSRVNARQRGALWRALHLIRRGRRDDAIAVLETCVRDREPAR
jgi:hypothetical protein